MVIRCRPWSDKCTHQSQFTREQDLLYAFLSNFLLVPQHPLHLNAPLEVCIVPQTPLEQPKYSSSSCFPLHVSTGAGWTSPKLYLKFLDGTAIIIRRLLVLGIVFVIPTICVSVCSIVFCFIFHNLLH